jgi:hypothetical protein
LQFSEIRNSARKLIEGQADKDSVRAEFIEAANLFKFKHLLDVAESAQQSDGDSVLFRTANFILANYNEQFYYYLYSLIDTAKAYLQSEEDTINFVAVIYNLANFLDIVHICDALSWEYSELEEINKPEASKHLYAEELLEEFEEQIHALEVHIKPELISICEDIVKRYDKEYIDDLRLEFDLD